MKQPRIYFAVLLALLWAACATTSSLQPPYVMQEWVGQSFSKLKKEWPKASFSSETWNGNGKIYVWSVKEQMQVPPPTKAKDSNTKREYTGPAKSDTIHYKVVTRFFVDQKDIIKKWEITQTSFDQQTKQP